MQKMWLRGANSEFPKCRGGDGTYDVLTLGAKAHLGGAKAPPPVNAALLITIRVYTHTVHYIVTAIVYYVCKFSFNIINVFSKINESREFWYLLEFLTSFSVSNETLCTGFL